MFMPSHIVRRNLFKWNQVFIFMSTMKKIINCLFRFFYCYNCIETQKKKKGTLVMYFFDRIGVYSELRNNLWQFIMKAQNMWSYFTYVYITNLKKNLHQMKLNRLSWRIFIVSYSLHNRYWRKFTSDESKEKITIFCKHNKFRKIWWIKIKL